MLERVRGIRSTVGAPCRIHDRTAFGFFAVDQIARTGRCCRVLRRDCTVAADRRVWFMLIRQRLPARNRYIEADLSKDGEQVR
jgi:hypothetical protein